MIDFSLPPEHLDLRERVAAFVRDEVIPRESGPRQDGHGPSDALRLELVGLARAAFSRRTRRSSGAASVLITVAWRSCSRPPATACSGRSR